MPRFTSPDGVGATLSRNRTKASLGLALVIGATSIALGLIVLAGWTLDIQAVKSVKSEWATMKPNTALGFVLAGGALCLVQSKTRLGRSAAFVFASATALLGLVTLIQYLLGVNFGIDQAVFNTPEETLSPGRPASITALNFTFLGIALILLCTRNELFRGIAQMVAIPVLGLAYLAVLGYMLSAASLYQVPGFTTVAFHTALGQLLLGIGVMASSPETGMIRILISPGQAGQLGRVLVLASVVLFPILGWMSEQAEATGIFSDEMAIALILSITLAAVLSSIVLPLDALIRTEVERERLSTLVAASKRTENTFRNVLNAAPDGMLVVDQSGKIVMANAETEKLFGYTREELIDQSVDILVPASVRRAHKKYRSGFLQSPSTRPMGQGLKLAGRHKDGSEVPVEIALSPLETDTGDFVIASVRDISERLRFYEALSEKNIELERASKAKDHFLAHMSHELRTPLTVILGFIKTMMMQTAGPLNAEQERQATKIESSAAHLLSLLDDLLDLAKIESGTNEISFEPVDLRSVLEDLEASWQPEAASKGLSLSTKCPPRLDLAHSNRRIVTQILQNLLSNSIKFTDRGSVRVVAEREFRNDRTETRIHVIDTGIGIKPEDDDKLFQPFSQLNPDTYKGTGLGLLLCRNLARSIGGDITYESVPGRGSTFTLALTEEPSALALSRLAG